MCRLQKNSVLRIYKMSGAAREPLLPYGRNQAVNQHHLLSNKRQLGILLAVYENRFALGVA